MLVVVIGGRPLPQRRVGDHVCADRNRYQSILRVPAVGAKAIRGQISVSVVSERFRRLGNLLESRNQVRRSCIRSDGVYPNAGGSSAVIDAQLLPEIGALPLR